MSTTEIKLYDIFRKDLKLDDNRARIFAEVVQETIQNEVNHQNLEFKSQIKEDFFKIDIKMESLRGEIKDSKSDMIKWFFAFFITLVLMILGLYATILLK
jgi:hypothetical protein